MASTTSQLTVPEAINIVQQHEHGEIDPGVTSFLARIADGIRQRIRAQPSAYVLTKEEFAVFMYYRGVFGDDEVMQQAIGRFWDQFPPKPLDDQGHKESKGTLEEIPKLAFPQQSDSTPLPSRQRSPELQSSFKPFLPRLHHNSDKQSLPDESTTSDNDRAAYACGRCRLRKTRCSRELPACQLCKGQKLPCVYTDSSGNKTMKQFLEDMRKSISEIKSLTDVIDVGNGKPKRTISEDSQLTQGEPTPQTPQVHERHPESPENLYIDWARLVHTSNGEEYGLANSIKIWIQSLTRESWDWWPLHPSFRQLREDEVRIKRYCVSHYPRCLNPGLLNLLKGFRARTLDCAPQERARSFIRSFEK